MYLLWPPKVDPEADRIVTQSCNDLKAKYQALPNEPKAVRYLACAGHINDVVKALVDGTKILPGDARQVAWRRMVEVCKYNTP